MQNVDLYYGRNAQRAGPTGSARNRQSALYKENRLTSLLKRTLFTVRGAARMLWQALAHGTRGI